MALLALAALAVCAAGCSPGSPGYSGSAEAVVLSRLPAGLPQHLALARGLSAADAAAASPADPGRTSGFLASSSFGEGYIRTWTQDADYVTAMALAFKDQGDAQRMVDFEVGQLKKGVNTYVTAHSEVPGSSVFVISSQTRSGKKDVICEGVWLPAGHYAVETLTCSAGGAWATWAEKLADSELAQERQVSG